MWQSTLKVEPPVGKCFRKWNFPCDDQICIDDIVIGSDRSWGTICFVFYNNAPESKAVTVNNKRKIFSFMTRPSWCRCSSTPTHTLVWADASIASFSHLRCSLSSGLHRMFCFFFSIHLYYYSRFHVGMGLFSNRSQKTLTCGKHISDTLACSSCATSLLLPQDGAKTTHIFLKHMY